MRKAHHILFEEHKLIYGRVPKVANSSIKAALSKLLRLPLDENIKLTSDSFWKSGTHGETRMLKLKDAYDLRETHFSFSFVRNPFDRIVSAYNNKVIENAKVTKGMAATGMKHGMSFPDFVEIFWKTDNAKMDVHIMPQSTMLVFKKKICPRFVGRFEYLENDWKSLIQIMKSRGLAQLGKLPKKNIRRSDKSDLKNYFTNTTLIDRVLEKYEDDLKYFYPDVSVDDMLSMKMPESMKPIYIEPS